MERVIVALGLLLVGMLGFTAGWFARSSREPRLRGEVLDFTPRVVRKDDVA